MLDKNHLARTVCTILDWHRVNVTGKWILHPIYAIYLAQGLVDSIGTLMKARDVLF